MNCYSVPFFIYFELSLRSCQQDFVCATCGGRKPKRAMDPRQSANCIFWLTLPLTTGKAWNCAICEGNPLSSACYCFTFPWMVKKLRKPEYSTHRYIGKRLWSTEPRCLSHSRKLRGNTPRLLLQRNSTQEVKQEHWGQRKSWPMVTHKCFNIHYSNCDLFIFSCNRMNNEESY